MKDKTIKALAGITGLTILEITALTLGYDGMLFGVVIAAIAGLAGYTIGRKTS